jgi:hypothetical protein
MKRTDAPHLRVVRDESACPATHREPIQLDLLLDRSESLVVFVGEPNLSGEVISRTLRTLRPNYVLDFRTCPRFDILGYSRKKAFTDFELCQAKYVTPSSEEASGDTSKRVAALLSKLSTDSQNLVGPLLVLVETEEAVELVFHALPKSKAKCGAWTLAVEGLAWNALA